MALELTQLQAATDDLWNNTDPIDIQFLDNPLLWILLKRAKSPQFDDYFVKASELVDGGKTIKVPLEHDEGHSGSYGQTTVIPRSKKDIINAAYFPWGGVFASNSLGLNDKVQNAGVEAIVNLSYRYIQNVLKTAWKNLGIAVFSRTAGDDDAIKALITDMFNTTTSTAYGGIAEDDMAKWAAVRETVGGAIDFARLQAIWRAPATGQAKMKRPDLGITTELLKDAYENSLQSQRRYADPKLVEAGFDNILHKQAPIVSDDLVPSGGLMGLNTNYLKLKAHNMYNFTKPKWIAMEESGQPDNIYCNTRWIGQLVCTHRKAHVYATGLTA